MKNYYAQNYCILSNETYSFTEEFLCNNNDWILVFEDDFNGNKLNEDNWEIKTGVIRDPDFELQKAWHTPENIVVENGVLKIVTKKETLSNKPVVTNWNPYTVKYENFDYTSGEVWSKKKFRFGKYEIRCKIPKGKGFFPAFWLYGGGYIYNEIDIFEFNTRNADGVLDINNLSKLHLMTLHYDFDGDGVLEGKDVNNNPVESCYRHYLGPDFSTDFFTFGLEWDEYKIHWYVSNDLGVIYEKKSTRLLNIPLHGQDLLPTECEDIIIGKIYKKELVFPNESMNIIMNLAIETGIYAPDATTPFPSEFQIDYIKVWQRESECCTPYKIYEATDNLPVNTQTKEYIRAGSDAGLSNISGNVTVKSGQNVTFKSPYIELLPGFETELGANFVAEAVPCTQPAESVNNDITIISVPDKFSPDGDGWQDELIVNVNGAAYYDIWVRDKLNVNTFYSASNVPVNSNYISVWDGSCNMNCGLYHKCSRTRNVHLTFHNCENTEAGSYEVDVECFTKSADSITDDKLYNLYADELTAKKTSINKITAIYDKFESSPNPFTVTTDIIFGIKNEEKIHLYLINTLGICVLELANDIFDNGNHKITINGNQIPSGVYYCVFETEYERKFIRIVKN